jgi:hypothetical protein
LHDNWCGVLTSAGWVGLAQASKRISSGLSQSYYIGKYSEYTVRWAQKCSLTPEHSKNVNAARNALSEYADANYTAYSTAGLFGQVTKGASKAVIALSGQALQDTRDTFSKIKSFAGSSFSFFSRLASFLAYDDRKGMVNLDSIGVHGKRGVSLLRNASYFSYYGNSLAEKTEKVLERQKRLTLDMAMDIFWDLKSIVLSAANLLPLPHPIPSSVSLSLNTICGYYYFGKSIAEEETGSQGLKQAQAVCRSLGIK